MLLKQGCTLLPASFLSYDYFITIYFHLPQVVLPIYTCVHRQGTKAHLYNSTLNCFFQIIQKEGIGALYAGVIPRLGRVVPGQGIIFMSFESIESALQSNFTFFQ
jgi:Mitochondrial carrier protein